MQGSTILIAVFAIIIIIFIIAAIAYVIYYTNQTKTKGYGETCSSQSECGTGLVCDQSVCREGLSSTCGTSNICASFLQCTNAKCAPKPPQTTTNSITNPTTEGISTVNRTVATRSAPLALATSDSGIGNGLTNPNV